MVQWPGAALARIPPLTSFGESTVKMHLIGGAVLSALLAFGPAHVRGQRHRAGAGAGHARPGTRRPSPRRRQPTERLNASRPRSLARRLHAVCAGSGRHRRRGGRRGQGRQGAAREGLRLSPTSPSARRSIRERTLFRPGSVSKLFTWTAVMQLVEQGKLDLDADVNQYLDFKIPPSTASRSRCATS